MSISAPRYSSGPLPRLDRQSRLWSVASQEFRHRVQAAVLLPVVFCYMGVVLTTVVFVYLESIFGMVSLGTFAIAFQSPIWPYLILIVTATAGAGALAEDAGSGAIVLYLSRPIRLLDYLSAKTISVGAWLVVAAICPGLLAVGITAVLGMENAPIAFQAGAGFFAVGLLAAIFFTGLALALSSLTKRPLYAGVGIFGLVLTLNIGVSLVSGISGNSQVSYADPISDVLAVAQSAFSVSGSSPIDPAVAASVLLGAGVLLWAFAALMLRRTQVIRE
jgi:ABC-type transport system involved in multi-copper enzyme maturation permease subunit